jgi:hypothetical protein
VNSKNERQAEHLATFYPAVRRRDRGRDFQEQLALPKLKVTPAGQQYFDQIVLSILVLERWKMSNQ